MPRPLLLPDGRVRVCDVHETGARGVVVAAEETLPARHAHVRGGDGNVAVPVDAVATGGPPGRVVDPVVRAVGGRERGDRALGVVGHHAHVAREERLVLVVHTGGDVRPPEEGLRGLAAVVQPCPHLDGRAVRPQPDPVHPLHAGESVEQAERALSALAALGAVPVQRSARPKPRSLGHGASGRGDLSEKVDDILADGFGR